MGALIDAVRGQHRSLLRTLSAHARGVGGQEPQRERDAFVTFLKGDLLPHARGEERHLYPLIDMLISVHERATATMTVDHEFITDYVARIERTTRELATATGGARQQLLGELRNLALRLDAVFELHLAKEERIYLPLIEKHMDAADQQRVLETIHSDRKENETMPSDQPLDVRDVAPRERHTRIFDAFNSLKPNEAFVLVNDHDPRPLYYQFEAEHTGQFSWDYLEQGPEVWRVRVGRRA